MRKSRFTESQIAAILKEYEANGKSSEVCRRHGIELKRSEVATKIEVPEARLRAAVAAAGGDLPHQWIHNVAHSLTVSWQTLMAAAISVWAGDADRSTEIRTFMEEVRSAVARAAGE